MGGGMMGSGGMWGQIGLRMVVADLEGIVVADSGQALIGERMEPEVLAQGIPIVAQGQQVGTLLLLNPSRYAPLQEAFLTTTNRAVLLAGLAAGAAALLIGTLLFVGIMRPLRSLQSAAQQVAAGDLTARVPVRNRDELGTLAESFNQMASGLDHQQQLRQQMVADIAHELRTPISVIQGTLEAMLDGILQPDLAEVRDLHTETRRLSRLVDDLRMLSLADAGQLALVRGPLDLAGLVESVVGRMAPLAETRGVELAAQVERPVPPVDGDADRLAQVLTNLIDNGLRYTPSGGHVTVSLKHQGGRLRLAVADDGPGIPAEELPYIFERFWRGDRSRSRHSGGSGIGLAIVRQLVELHGGTVEVESRVGQGSTFVVSLPVLSPA
jgi:signal transduction histidine kinase